MPAVMHVGTWTLRSRLCYVVSYPRHSFLETEHKLSSQFEGISSKLSEISIKPRTKNPLKLRLFDAVKEDRYDYQHEALIVRLKDGLSFVVDLAGPQFGHHVPVMPFDTYLKIMVRDKSSPTEHPFGYQRAEMVKGCIPKLHWDPRQVVFGASLKQFGLTSESSAAS